MLIAQLVPAGTSEEERAAAIAAAMSRVTKTALSRAAEMSFQNVQPRVDIIREQIKRTQQSSKKPGSKKDDHRGSRKDKDREQRK
ncbi:hypothetical protein AAVH_22634 [Aphelenchoides avenae]|nr:hypothetical protein AAVH_22634 [Aphelenchus avenae]